MRPRPIVLLCLSLWIVEAAKIIATCWLLFYLFSPGELVRSEFIIQTTVSFATIISLVGVFSLRWWGVYTYIAASTINAIIAVIAQPVQVFAMAFSVLLVIMLVVTILPHQKEFK